MKIGSLCTGYGGLDLAVEAVTGGHTIWYSEFDKQTAKIMQHHRPLISNLWDLTKVDWSQVEPIDVLTAGYPCQPFSGAGQRKGTNDPRHIWPSIAKAIGVLRPRLIVLENVRGHLTLGFDQVLANLASIGYDSRWQLVRACDVGAPHPRSRLFVIAYPNGQRLQGNKIKSGKPSPIINRDITEGDLSPINWGKHAKAIQRWESCTRKCPNPINDGRLEPKFVEWMMGLPDGWVTGTSLSKGQQLKALGNGVVPQQAAHALKLLLQ